MAKDFYGNELSAGDTVTYFQSGRYNHVRKAIVLDSATKVKISFLQEELGNKEKTTSVWPYFCVLTIDNKAVAGVSL